MPLIKSKSKAAFGKNVATEVKAGKPVKQAVAIAYATKRAAKKAAGGRMSSNPMDYDSDVDFYEAQRQNRYPKERYNEDFDYQDARAMRENQRKNAGKYVGMSIQDQIKHLLEVDKKREERIKQASSATKKASGGKVTKKHAW